MWRGRIDVKGAVMSRPDWLVEISNSFRAGRNLLTDRFANARRSDSVEDGVIVLTCERPAAEITVKGFAVLVLAFLIFKGLVIAHLGLETYAASIQKLEYGSFLEQAGAFLMRPDSASQTIAGLFGSVAG